MSSVEVGWEGGCVICVVMLVRFMWVLATPCLPLGVFFRLGPELGVGLGGLFWAQVAISGWGVVFIYVSFVPCVLPLVGGDFLGWSQVRFRRRGS
jgi:hypothetical protein